MPARRSLAAMEKDAKAADLFRRGATYRQIAAEIGWASPKSAFDAVRRAARDAASDPLAAAEAKALILDRLQDYRRLAWRVATATHYVTTQSGKVVCLIDEDGVETPLLDDAPILNSLDRMLRCDQEEARLRDLYPASKAQVKVITEDVIDGELAELARQIAENDARTAARTRPA